MLSVIQGLYLLSVLALAAYGLHAALHALFYLRCLRRPTRSAPSCAVGMPGALPAVTVQLPIRNERHVVSRLLAAVASLDWPRDRLQIQVLDDSDDDTTQIVAALIAEAEVSGLQIQHIHRTDRRGFKAGALQAGLDTAQGEFLAIFDADFAPAPDYLRRALHYFADPCVGCVQTRWGHLNAHASQLTRTQSLGIDGHFLIEQAVRHEAGAFLNFNGTAGIWRRACMDDAGGWEGDTLTEDLDLSYRAQLAGWRIAYACDIVVPAELPMQIDAFKRQQFRWAKGSLQTAQKLLWRVWRAPQPFWRKVQGTLHLTNYLVHPLMVINLLLLLPVMSSNSTLLRVAFLLTTAALGPPMMYWLAMRRRPWSSVRKLQELAVLMAIGTGLSLNNTRAALEAFLGIKSEFKRTPKFATTDQHTEWRNSSYALPRDPIVWFEAVFALYAFGLLFYSLATGRWWIVPWIALYACGFAYVALSAIAQARQLYVRSRQPAASPAIAPSLPTAPKEGAQVE